VGRQVNKQAAGARLLPLPVGGAAAVIQRFPHLREKLVTRSAENVEFLSLCEDYSSLVWALTSLKEKEIDQREELSMLKHALELEILERLFRSNSPDEEFSN